MAAQDWFQRAWEIREEDVYRRLFGLSAGSICVLTPDMFVSTFQQETIDPRWLHYGVFECPPTPTRASWLYVSSGLSNAWEDETPDPAGPSGLGMEFVLEAPHQATWAIARLQHVIAFQILLSCGRYPNRDLLDVHDRIPLRSSISGTTSDISWLVVGPGVGYDSTFELPTGHVDLLAVVGITDDEASFSRASGGGRLIELLLSSGGYPVTDPGRQSVLLSMVP